MRGDFREITSLLATACGQEAVARNLRVRPHTYQKMRADPESKHYRRPPVDWRIRLRPLATVARERFIEQADRVSAELLDETMEET